MGRTFAALKNYQVDGNKEMIAIGLMNIVGSSTSCYVTTGTYMTESVVYIYIYIIPKKTKFTLVIDQVHSRGQQ